MGGGMVMTCQLPMDNLPSILAAPAMILGFVWGVAAILRGLDWAWKKTRANQPDETIQEIPHPFPTPRAPNYLDRP